MFTTPDQKKKFAAYYTPSQVTDALSEWAIRSTRDKILEPSFGGCNFLMSSISTLRKLGARKPEKNIYGFDIDPKAFKILESKKLVSDNFVLGDFLKQEKAEDFYVDAITGNPPFVSIHKMDNEYKKNLFKTYKKHPFKIAQRSSLWVYFIVHSLQYLKRGGRMAWVVPDSITFSLYGKLFLNQLETRFEKVSVLRVGERFFLDSGTSEKTSFLFCEGYQQGTCKANILSFLSLKNALDSVIDLTLENNEEIIEHRSQGVNKNYEIKKLGDFFDIRIGIVIGASKLLILNSVKANLSPFKEFLYPIISKGKQLNNICIDRQQLIAESTTSIYLVDGITMETENPDLFSQLVLSIPTDILRNQTFQNREQLFGYDDFRHPDAFLTYYSQSQAKIIVNGKKQLNSTNSVHRLYLKKEFKNSKILLKFFALQTFAEIMHSETKAVAREYGNHIFKFEPSDATNIPLIAPKEITDDFKKEIAQLFSSTFKLVKKNKEAEAREKVNDYFSRLVNYLP